MKKHVTNTSSNCMFVGSTMIPPGESRTVEVPDEVAAPVVANGEPSLDDRLKIILAGNVASVLAELPTLTQEALDRAVLLEKDGGNRKGVLNGIDAELLTRANARLEAEQVAERARQLEAAQAALATAKAALDAETDPGKHPELETAVTSAQATVDALTADQA
ncbi:MAG: hypothetical protein V4451_04645 [Pseudomonadota bacterium]